MEKIKLEDVNILIDEYDEMLVELQRDDYNLYKNSIIPFGLSILLSPLIVVYVLNKFLKYNKDIFFIIFILIFFLIFFLIFLVVYNLLSIIGLNKVLNQIKSENKVNYNTSVIKGILKNIGFNFEKNKISWGYSIKPLYFIDYKQVNSIFEYRMYLKYEIVSKKKLLEELSKIRELKRNNKNVVIQFLKEKGIVLFIFTIITALINNYYPAIFEKLKNDGNIDSMNNIFFVHLSIFVSILVFPYIMSIFVKNGKNFQMQKLKVIENCVYYLNNFEKIEITETINKLEKQEKIVFEIKKLQVESDNNKTLKKLEELQVEIEENFGEISRKYLKEYRDIYNNQETSDEEKQEKLSNKLSELLISMETEKDFYRESKIIEIIKNKEKIYREVSKISNGILSEELQTKIKENFQEIPRKYLKEYQEIYNNQEISNEEKQKKLLNKLSKLLISMEVEKDFYKIEKVTKILTKIEKQEKIVFEIKKLQVESDNNKTLKKLEELQVEIEENFGEISRKYLKEYRDIYNNQETSDEEKQEKLSNKLSELLISMEIEKNLYKKSKILENQDLIKSKIINKKLWIILFLVILVVLYNNLGKKEYILNNPTNEDIVIITDSEKIKIPKNSNVKKNLEKFDIKFESGKKCELSFDSNKNERIINFTKNECFFQDELEIFEKKRNYILVNSTDNDIEITSNKNHYKLKSKYSIVLHLENGNYKLAEGCDLKVKDDSSGQLIKIKKENDKQKCDIINY